MRRRVLTPIIFFAISTLAAGCSGTDRSVSGPSRPQTSAQTPTTVVGVGVGVDAHLDQLLAASWHQKGIEPAALAGDSEFLRRVTLDLTGTIPNAAAVTAFIDDERGDKRERLVDALLASDAYAEHWANVYTELLLGGAERVRPGVAESTHAWLHERFGEGTPYDDVARDLITASGSSGAASPHGFLYTHGRQGRLEAVANQTSRIFLGVRLECAQCHDHPDDERFTQRDYYAFVAFFARTRVRGRGMQGKAPTIIDRPRGEMRMPTAHDGPGMRSGERVDPKFLEREVQLDPNETRRQALCDAIIESDLFAKATAGRTWSLLMGRGPVEPWDNLGSEQDPSHPPLLELIADRFARSGYDHRALVKTIVLSSAYQRTSVGTVDPVRRRRAFAQAEVRPLSPDQLFRSLLTVTGIQDIRGRRRKVQQLKQRALKEYKFVFTDDEMRSADRFSGNVPQALLLINGEVTNRGSIARPRGTLGAVLRQHEAATDRIAALHLAVLSRPPTDDELHTYARFVAERDSDAEAYEDLMHAMLLSSEFLTIH